MPGAGTSSTSQQQQQQSTTQPWQAAQPLLGNIINDLSATNPSVTSGQTNAYNTLTNATAGLQNNAASGQNVANSLFNYNTNPQQNTLNSAYSTEQQALSPYLSSSYLNPMTTPGFGAAMQGLNQGITNQVNDQFAAAGRDLSPGNTQALATGLSQGEGQLIANQYNTNVGNQQSAANSLYGAGSNTASGLTAQQQAQQAAQMGGLTAASAIPGLAVAPGSAQLGVATQQAQQPYTNLGWLSQLALPLGAMGSQSQGTSNTSGTSTASPLQDLQSLMSSIGSTSSNAATGASSASGLMALLSDERAKENIAEVGELKDGQSVYSYNYKGDSRPQIGLIAQEVERLRPDAVVEIGGLKHVDYGKATERSRMIGMLHELDLAA